MQGSVILVWVACQAFLSWGCEVHCYHDDSDPTDYPAAPISVPSVSSQNVAMAVPSAALPTDDPSKLSMERDSSFPIGTSFAHQVKGNVSPLVVEYIRHVPVVKKTIRQQEETSTQQVPVFEKIVSTQEEKIMRHTPIIKKYIRPVVETRTRMVPVVKMRSRIVKEPYTTHMMVTEKYSRPVEDTIESKVPVVEMKVRPVVYHRIHHVPITERRTRPIVETHVVNIPVRQRIVQRPVVQKIRPLICLSDEYCPTPLINMSHPLISDSVKANTKLPDISFTSGESLIPKPPRTCSESSGLIS